MSPRRSTHPHVEPTAESQESTRRRLEDARRVVESKLAWLERAEDLTHISNDVKELGKQLSRLETMVMGFYAALEPHQPTQSNQGGELDRYCIRAKEVAKFIGVAETTLAQWRMTGEGPQFVKNGPRQVLYRIGDVRAWVDKKVVSNTAEYYVREHR
jgi:predicted DNA-binding transcriptional regulator AlpA